MHNRTTLWLVDTRFRSPERVRLVIIHLYSELAMEARTAARDPYRSHTARRLAARTREMLAVFGKRLDAETYEPVAS